MSGWPTGDRCRSAGFVTWIYERIIDVMRQIQREEISPEAVTEGSGNTELESEVND